MTQYASPTPTTAPDPVLAAHAPTCRAADCRRTVAAPGMSRCQEHAFRWTPGAPVERVQESPWVRKARAHTLPAKAF